MWSYVAFTRFFFIFFANNSRAFPICCIESIEWISKYQLKKGIEKYGEHVIAILRKDKKMKVYQGQTGQPPIVSPAQQFSNFFIFFIGYYYLSWFLRLTWLKLELIADAPTRVLRLLGDTISSITSRQKIIFFVCVVRYWRKAKFAIFDTLICVAKLKSFNSKVCNCASDFVTLKSRLTFPICGGKKCLCEPVYSRYNEDWRNYFASDCCNEKLVRDTREDSIVSKSKSSACIDFYRRAQAERENRDIDIERFTQGVSRLFFFHLHAVACTTRYASRKSSHPYGFSNTRFPKN